MVGKIVKCVFCDQYVPVDWMSACVIPLYKGKGDKYECTSFRDICLLSVVGKV